MILTSDIFSGGHCSTEYCELLSVCFMVQLFTALSTGCVESLIQLDVSRNFCSTKRPSKDSPAAWTEFFSSAKALKIVDFSSNRLPQETLK